MIQNVKQKLLDIPRLQALANRKTYKIQTVNLNYFKQRCMVGYRFFTEPTENTLKNQTEFFGSVSVGYTDFWTPLVSTANLAGTSALC